MDYHSELVLAFLDRLAKVSFNDLRVARELILATLLQKIVDCLGGEHAGSGDYTKEDLAGKAHRDGSHGEFVQGETPTILNSRNSPNHEHHL